MTAGPAAWGVSLNAVLLHPSPPCPQLPTKTPMLSFMRSGAQFKIYSTIKSVTSCKSRENCGSIYHQTVSNDTVRQVGQWSVMVVEKLVERGRPIYFYDSFPDLPFAADVFFSIFLFPCSIIGLLKNSTTFQAHVIAILLHQVGFGDVVVVTLFILTPLMKTVTVTVCGTTSWV